MKIGSREVGPGHPCCIVAELSNNHNGSLERALRLLEAAKAAGADVAKVQAYTPDELVNLRGDGPAPEPWQHYTMRELYTKAKTPLVWLPGLFAYARELGFPLFSSVFGPESLAALETVGCPAYKISHFEDDNATLLGLVHATGRPVLVSSARRWTMMRDARWDIVYCPGGYPAQPTEMHLDHLNSTWLGLSSHCREPLVAPLAVARGAHYLEYHFHLGAEPSELESSVSLNEIQFREMVNSVRGAEELLGD